MLPGEDPELHELFVAEVEERSARLVAGSERLGGREAADDLIRSMVWEGHAIKGTARMMGHTALADAGGLLEEAWRRLGRAEEEPAASLIDALRSLAGALPEEARRDLTKETPRLEVQLRTLRHELQLDPAPPPGPEVHDAILVTAGGHTWGLLESLVLDRLHIGASGLREADERTEIPWDGGTIPVYPLAEAVGLEQLREPGRIIVVSTPAGPVGFAVEGEIGSRQVSTRSLGPVLNGEPHLTAAALVEEGDVIVLLNPAWLAERIQSTPRQRGRRHRVLVVDDSSGARQVVGATLGMAGFEVELAGSPAEALSALARRRFDAIVLDFLMPTTDGASLALLARTLGVEAPILMLSGAATSHDRRRGLDAGANAYLSKDHATEGALTAIVRGMIGP